MRLDLEAPTGELETSEADVQCLVEAADELAALYGTERDVIIRALDAIIRKQAALERMKGKFSAFTRSPSC